MARMFTDPRKGKQQCCTETHFLPLWRAAALRVVLVLQRRAMVEEQFKDIFPAIFPSFLTEMNKNPRKSSLEVSVFIAKEGGCQKMALRDL